MRWYQILIPIIAVIIIAAEIVTENGWLLQLVGDHYGREYNKERIKQGQPIIEDYFVRKPQKKDKRIQVWSDTTGMHVHTYKSYYLSEYGKLAYEADCYKLPVDTIWLKKMLYLTELDTLDTWEFQRLFYPSKGVDSYSIMYNLKGEPFKTAILDMYEGDSLYRTIIGAPIENRVPSSGPPFKSY